MNESRHVLSQATCTVSRHEARCVDVVQTQTPTPEWLSPSEGRRASSSAPPRDSESFPIPFSVAADLVPGEDVQRATAKIRTASMQPDQPCQPIGTLQPRGVDGPTEPWLGSADTSQPSGGLSAIQLPH